MTKKKQMKKKSTGGIVTLQDKADAVASAEQMKVKFDFNKASGSSSTGGKRNVSQLSDVSDTSSARHDSTRMRIDSGASVDTHLIATSTTCASLTTATITVSTAAASGSIPSSMSVSSGANQVPTCTSVTTPGTSTVPSQVHNAGHSTAPSPTTTAGPRNAPNPTENAASGPAPTLSPADIAQALNQLPQNNDVTDYLTDTFTRIVLNLTKSYDDRYVGDQQIITELRQELSDLKADVNDLEQYSRRNSVRISNPNWREHPWENCRELVLSLCQDLGLDIHPSMIDRTHRAGKFNRNRGRDILVKFIGYGPKRALLDARSKAGSDPYFRGIYINEDLTSTNGKLFSQARKLKSDNKLFSASTRDGRVCVARFRGDNTAVVKNESELNAVASRGTYASAVQRPPPTENINDRLLRVAGLNPRAPPQGSTQAPPRSPQTQRPQERARFSVQQIPPLRPNQQQNQNSQSRTPARSTAVSNAPAAATSTSQAGAAPAPSVPQQGASGGTGITNTPQPVSSSTPMSSRQRSSSLTENRHDSFSFETY